MGEIQNIDSESVRIFPFSFFFLPLIHSSRVNLRINDRNGHPIVISCPTLPENLRRGVMDHLQLIYPHLFKHTDSSKPEGSNTYHAIHFTWYNRFCEKVMSTQCIQLFNSLINRNRERIRHLAPILAILYDQSRTALFLYQERLQKRQKSPQTMLQSTSSWKPPWKRFLTGSEIRFATLFCNLVRLANFSQLKALLPDNYKVLSAFADVLPCQGFSPVYPYTGFVLNFNVATKIHRDKNDKGFCLVMPLFTHGTTGGDLCFYELGLALQLDSLDGVFFSSNTLTHFNLNFIGFRSSLVFHTDAAASRWVNTFNGWQDNKYLSCRRFNTQEEAFADHKPGEEVSNSNSE